MVADPVGSGEQAVKSLEFVTKRTTMRAGRLIINRIARDLRSYFHNSDVEGYSVEVDTGWPSGVIYISITDSPAEVERHLRNLEAHYGIDDGS